jgi:hypothetical protein
MRGAELLLFPATKASLEVTLRHFTVPQGLETGPEKTAFRSF